MCAGRRGLRLDAGRGPDLGAAHRGFSARNGSRQLWGPEAPNQGVCRAVPSETRRGASCLVASLLLLVVALLGVPWPRCCPPPPLVSNPCISSLLVRTPVTLDVGPTGSSVTSA